jgi:hypothetical protein
MVMIIRLALFSFMLTLSFVCLALTGTSDQNRRNRHPGDKNFCRLLSSQQRPLGARIDRSAKRVSRIAVSASG